VAAGPPRAMPLRFSFHLSTYSQIQENQIRRYAQRRGAAAFYLRRGLCQLARCC
jgi:hypothetical protein